MTKPSSDDQLAQDLASTRELTKMAKDFEASWRKCDYLTPRQAYAIASTLDLWADGDIGEWLKDPDDKPLHEVRPFEYFDRRVMVHVRQNRAWAAKVAERCYAISVEIQAGVLPFDRPGAFIDELLVVATLEEAQTHLLEAPELFERILPRLAHESDDDGWAIGDEDWEDVSDQFDDMRRWVDGVAPLFFRSSVAPSALGRSAPVYLV